MKEVSISFRNLSFHGNDSFIIEWTLGPYRQTHLSTGPNERSISIGAEGKIKKSSCFNNFNIFFIDPTSIPSWDSHQLI